MNTWKCNSLSEWTLSFLKISGISRCIGYSVAFFLKDVHLGLLIIYLNIVLEYCCYRRCDWFVRIWPFQWIYCLLPPIRTNSIFFLVIKWKQQIKRLGLFQVISVWFVLKKKLLISDWNKKRGCPHRGCKNRAETGIWSHTKMLIYKQCTHNRLPVCKFAVYTIYEQVMRNTRADKLTTTHWKSNFSDIPDVIRFLPHCGGFLRLRMLYI